MAYEYHARIPVYVIRSSLYGNLLCTKVRRRWSTKLLRVRKLLRFQSDGEWSFPIPFLCVLLLLSLKKCCDWQHSRIDWDMFQFSRSLGGMRNTSCRKTLYNLAQHPIDNAATDFAVTACFSLLVARMCARSCISTTWSSAWRTRTSQSWRQRPLVLVQVRQLWIDDFVKTSAGLWSRSRGDWLMRIWVFFSFFRVHAQGHCHRKLQSCMNSWLNKAYFADSQLAVVGDQCGGGGGGGAIVSQVGNVCWRFLGQHTIFQIGARLVLNRSKFTERWRWPPNPPPPLSKREDQWIAKLESHPWVPEILSPLFCCFP